MQLTHGLHRCRSLHAGTTGAVCQGRSLSWGLLGERVARLAGGLKSLGAKRGDRIAILAANSDRYIEAYYAIAWAGCVPVPFNTRWAAAEIAYALDDSRPVIVMLDKSFAGHGEACARDGLIAVQMDDIATGGDMPSFASLVASNDPAEDACGDGDDLATIFYTGGTTGQSKGVMLSHHNLIVNFLSLQAVSPYDAGTVFLHTAPMFHLADAGTLFGLTMLGATHVVLPGFDAGTMIDAISEHRINAFFLVPTMIGMLCEALRDRPADMSGVRRITYGASPISESLLAEAMRLFPLANFSQGYGQTELSPYATVLVHQDHLDGRLSSAGRPVPQVELRIVDEALRDVPAGEVGEIAVRGPGVMQGYWNLPDLTSRTIVDGWLRTGDAGRLDRGGYLYLVDRVKDMIVSGGENIYSVEVENALLRHDDVLQCAVIGIPHPRWGEAVHAVLYLRAGSMVTEGDLIEHCVPLIANYKRPKSFDLRTSPLPVSGVGKISKAELREPFWRDAGRRVS